MLDHLIAWSGATRAVADYGASLTNFLHCLHKTEIVVVYKRLGLKAEVW
jgi:hypothetical protein